VLSRTKLHVDWPFVSGASTQKHEYAAAEQIQLQITIIREQ
jgi:hypothetical protein